MATKKEVVGTVATITIKGKALMNAIELRHAKERKTGKLVSMADLVRDMITREYNEYMMKETEERE